MRDLLGWKLMLLRPRGVALNIHLLFVLYGIYWLYICSQMETAGAVGWGLLVLGILLGSVLIHEIGHAWVASRKQLEVRELTLWPLGGLVSPQFPHWIYDDQAAARQELILASAGPLTNLLVCLIVLPFILAFQIPMMDLVVVLAPPQLENTGLQVLALVFWANWLLMLVNLLPASPLDGAQILKAILWRRLGYQMASHWVACATRITAISLFALGLILSPHYPVAAVTLLMLGVFCFGSAEVDSPKTQDLPEEPEHYLGYDFSQGYTSLERDIDAKQEPQPDLGPFQKWLDSRRALRSERERQVALEEERKFDEILIRIHEVGWENLTEEERKLAKRVSERTRKNGSRKSS
ncbi:Hypothetical protein PBC10988_17490 [Planctomycetales bacterium 10988]|nr:Hypothetical protein PBC10988_17490 [Planctomycetales bacterium 10988]